ncbi:MAG: hypothetical protein RI568_11935 [Natronomonas sp.]|uniref:hypothetical protein n=1 Tax=Natronomonas sp. TaxID=2184060 RepID=UPI0028707DEB|nr:hypothetical protein [Natronomonas sp.]MDR9431390.1 hypothetical protein [Natronomonas sp.]
MVYRAGIIGTGGIAGMGILGMHDTEDIGDSIVFLADSRTKHTNGEAVVVSKQYFAYERYEE